MLALAYVTAQSHVFFGAGVDPLSYAALGSPPTVYALTFLAVSGALCLCVALVRLVLRDRLFSAR